MENQLSKFTVTELKALVYDELAKAEQAQANIRILNQELRNRYQPPVSQEGEQSTTPTNSGEPTVA